MSTDGSSVDTKNPDTIAYQKRLALRRAARTPGSIVFNFIVFPLFVLATIWLYTKPDIACLNKDCSSVEYRAQKILKENPLIGNPELLRAFHLLT